MKQIYYGSNSDIDGLAVIDATVYGDYVGNGLLGKSNYEFLKKEFARCKGVYDVSGGYGYSAIYYNPAELTKNVKIRLDEILDSLARYPFLDEDDYSQREENCKEELLTELKKEFEEKFPYSDFNTISSELYDKIEIENNCAIIREKDKEALFNGEFVYSCENYKVYRQGKLYTVNQDITIKFDGYSFDILGVNFADILGVNFADITPEFLAILAEIKEGTI